MQGPWYATISGLIVHMGKRVHVNRWLKTLPTAVSTVGKILIQKELPGSKQSKIEIVGQKYRHFYL